MHSGTHSNSTSSIDGVPVRISHQFLPPKKVTLPLHYEVSNPTELLFMEYDFSLEEKVLEWSEAQEQMREALEQLELERQQEEEERKKKEEEIRKREEELAQELRKQEILEEEKRMLDEIKRKKDQTTESTGKEETEETTSENKTSNDESAESKTENASASENNSDVNDPASVLNVPTAESVPLAPQNTGTAQQVPTVAQNVPTVAQNIAAVASKTNYPVVCNGILMPTQAKPTNVQSGTKVNGFEDNFDIKDFEVKHDMFDDLELDTINDLEELNKVLQPTQPKNMNSVGTGYSYSPRTVNTTPSGYSYTPQGVQMTQPAQTQSTSSATGYSYAPQMGLGAQPKTGNSASGFSYNPQIGQSGAYPQNVNTGVGVTNFQQLSRANTGHPGVNTSQPNVNINPNSGHASYTPAQTNSESIKQSHPNAVRLPPIPNRSSSPQTSTYNNTGPQTSVYNNSQYSRNYNPFASGTSNSQPTGANSQYNPNTTTPVAFSNHQQSTASRNYSNFLNQFIQNQNIVHGISSGPNSNANKSGSLSGRSTPAELKTNNSGTLRSAKSTPDITALVDNTEVSPPGVSRHSRTKTPPPRPSSNQGWNPFSPLPPTSPRDSTSSPNTSQSPPQPSKPQELPNPYKELSVEGRNLVNNMTSMGFPQGRAARVVQKLGPDDKKVIDHLCLLNNFIERGHKEQTVEKAFKLLNNDDKKVSQYLTLMNQFKEFGFNEDKISEALIKHNLAEDKCLDYLTGS